MKRVFVKILVAFAAFLALACQSQSSVAQLRTDTIVMVEENPTPHSAKKATLYSTFLPGLGQIYNKKLWYVKVPIIYAGFGGLIYAINWNNNELKRFKKAYNAYPDDEFEGVISQDQLIDYVDYYRRNRDLSVIGIALLWGLNVIEANVTGHFYNYDISPDLSLKLEPTFRRNFAQQPELGFRLAVNF